MGWGGEGGQEPEAASECEEGARGGGGDSGPLRSVSEAPPTPSDRRERSRLTVGRGEGRAPPGGGEGWGTALFGGGMLPPPGGVAGGGGERSSPLRSVLGGGEGLVSTPPGKVAAKAGQQPQPGGGVLASWFSFLLIPPPESL